LNVSAIEITIASIWIVLGWVLVQQQTTQKKNMATQAELAEVIRKSNAQTRKGIDEVVGKIAALEKLILDGAASEELTAAVAELRVSTQVLDDVVRDAPAEPPVEPPSE